MVTCAQRDCFGTKPGMGRWHRLSWVDDPRATVRARYSRGSSPYWPQAARASRAGSEQRSCSRRIGDGRQRLHGFARRATGCEEERGRRVSESADDRVDVVGEPGGLAGEIAPDDFPGSPAAHVRLKTPGYGALQLE